MDDLPAFSDPMEAVQFGITAIEIHHVGTARRHLRSLMMEMGSAQMLPGVMWCVSEIVRLLPEDYPEAAALPDPSLLRQLANEDLCRIVNAARSGRNQDILTMWDWMDGRRAEMVLFDLMLRVAALGGRVDLRERAWPGVSDTL